MPLFHIHGLVASVLAPVSAGSTVVCTPGFDPLRFMSWLEACRATWYTAVPTMHMAVLERARAESRARESSDSSAPPRPRCRRSWRRARRPLRRARARGVRNDRSRTPDGGQSVASGRAEAGLGRARRRAGDRSARRRRSASPGGRGRRGCRSRAERLRGLRAKRGREPGVVHRRWFRTGDQGYLDDDGYLFLRGRLKEIINRGGEKVSPREVEEVLLGNEAVADAVVFAQPHARLGETVAAAVIPRNGSASSAQESGTSHRRGLRRTRSRPPSSSSTSSRRGPPARFSASASPTG